MIVGISILIGVTVNAYLDTSLAKLVEWVRLPGDLIFGIVGVLPVVLAIGMTYWYTRKKRVQ
jgi:nitric oxide reductase subunit B